MHRIYIMAYITLLATLVQDPTRSRFLWVRKTTYMNDYLSVFESQIGRSSKLPKCLCHNFYKTRRFGTNCIEEQYVHKEKSL